MRRLSFAVRMVLAAGLATVVVGAADPWKSGQRVLRSEFDLATVGAASVDAPAAVDEPAPVPVPVAVETTTPVATTPPVATTAVRAPVVTTTPAPSTTVRAVAVAVSAPATPTIEERGEAALELVPFDVDRTGYRVIFEGNRDGYLGLTSTVQKTITIYIRSSQSLRDIAKVIAHEVGHAIDVDFTTEVERSLYRHVRGIDGRSWYPNCSGCTDYDSVAGDFAETFAVAMVGEVNFLSTVAPVPTTAQLTALQAVFTI